MSVRLIVRHARTSLLKVAISFLGIFALGMPVLAHADVNVTEIMYNPLGSNTGHQWIEVTNTGTSPIDLGAKDIRFFDASGNHLIKAYGGNGTMLAAGTSAVIAQDPLTFLSDYASFSGQLLKSSFTLTASGILGITQTDGTILDKVSYASTQGAKGDGNSLQRTQSGTFIAGAPTPDTYPLTPPAPLSAPMKQIAPSKSSTKQGSKALISKKHEKGTVAPADSADAASAGALGADGPGNGAFGMPSFAFSVPTFSMPAFIAPYMPALSSAWFVVFLALVGFSAFSILMIQRQYYV